MAHLPAAVSLLLLEALFMQISGVSLTLTWPRRLCLFRVLLGASHCYKLSPFQAHWGMWCYTRILWLACLFTVHMGRCTSPSPVEFSFHRHFYKLSLSWLLGVCCRSCLLRLACLFTVPWGISPPPLQCSGHSALFATCLFCCRCLLFSFFSLFSLGRGWSVLGAMLILSRVVCGSTTCRLAHLVVYVFPSGLGASIWWRGSPPGFSI
jgi:hypothetical protein